MTRDSLAQLPVRIAMVVEECMNAGGNVIDGTASGVVMVDDPPRRCFPLLRSARFTAIGPGRPKGLRSRWFWARDRNEEEEAIADVNPAPGLPVTWCMLSDRVVGKIVRVERNGRRLVFERRGEELVGTERPDGRYQVRGNRGRLLIGVDSPYHDPHF